MSYTVGTRLGILGGGQLARMLTEAATSLGLLPVIFTERVDDPAAQLGSKCILGNYSQVEKLKEFFSQVDSVIFENEFIPCSLLEEISKPYNTIFLPSLSAMALLQDKLNQKRVLQSLGIPTTPFLECPAGADLRAWVKSAIVHFGGECVLKWAQLGYDGKGTFFASPNTKDTDHDSTSLIDKAVSFCERAKSAKIAAEFIPRFIPKLIKNSGAILYAEQKISFKREVALVACRSALGAEGTKTGLLTNDFGSYPLVISQQQNGVCLKVLGPASAFGVSTKLEEDARNYAKKLAEAIPLYGTFAIEFFETDNGLLVNEIAPRVHNTGHFSLDASETSQFENHVRCVLGLPPGSTRSAAGFAMLNLLGPPGHVKNTSGGSLPPTPPSLHFHWYGKGELRPGRKMGHVTGVAASGASPKAAEAILSLVNELDLYEKNWQKSL